MNLSSNDRLVRVFGGFVMVGVEYASEFNWDVLLLAIGCWSLLTSAVGLGDVLIERLKNAEIEFKVIS